MLFGKTCRFVGAGYDRSSVAADCGACADVYAVKLALLHAIKARAIKPVNFGFNGVSFLRGMCRTACHSHPHNG
jgi:hypothetical protein